jgi:hypothetical protein
VSATLKTVWLRVSKYKPENFLSAHFNSPAIHEFFAEMAKSAQNFAGQPFFELFGEVFSNVTLRLVSRNPSGGTGFRLVNAPRMTAGGKRSNVLLNVLDLLCGQHRAQPGVAGLLKRGTNGWELYRYF